MRESLVDREPIERLLLLAAAIRTGLIDALAREGYHSAEDIAAIAQTDLRATGVILEALSAENIVDRSALKGSARFRLTGLGRTHLVDPGPDLERAGLLHLANRVRGWSDLADVVKTGQPTKRDDAYRDVRNFVSAMGERNPEIVDEIVENCLTYAGRIQTMIDIGGAVGHMARRFSHCGVRATLMDLERVIPIARDFLGPDEADIALVGGDFTKDLPAGPFDLAYFGNVFHIYGPDTCRQLAEKAGTILTPEGTIAVQDLVWGRSARAPMFAVNMLQATHDGGVWTESQYREWLDEAGFVDIQVVDLETATTQLILGRKGSHGAISS